MALSQALYWLTINYTILLLFIMCLDSCLVNSHICLFPPPPPPPLSRSLSITHSVLSSVFFLYLCCISAFWLSFFYCVGSDGLNLIHSFIIIIIYFFSYYVCNVHMFFLLLRSIGPQCTTNKWTILLSGIIESTPLVQRKILYKLFSYIWNGVFVAARLSTIQFFSVRELLFSAYAPSTSHIIQMVRIICVTS